MAAPKKAVQISQPTPQVTPAKGRKKLTPEQKAARAAMLKAESKPDKLVRLTGPRMEKALKAIKAVGNLAAYKPNEKQIQQIGDALVDAVNTLQMRLQGAKKESYVFRLER